jgi:hypothetical protein
MVDPEARERIQALEELAAQRDREVAKLSSTVSRLAATVEAIRASLLLPSPALPSNPPTPARPAPFVGAIEELRADFWALKAWCAGFASLIVADFPALFSEFGRKRFTLLWRGSRDGFGARDFHSPCDGHAPTLTLIQDTAGNIFGGFTPVEWESHMGGKFKADPSLMSFLFALKNPHNFPARTFALKADMKDYAIGCKSSGGPWFNGLCVSGNCNTNDSWSRIDLSYTNDTGLDGTHVLTGSRMFTVKEIEVFEIAD